MTALDQHLPRAAPVPATRAELATLWVDDPRAVFNVALLCRFAAGPFARPDGSVDVDAVGAEVARRTADVVFLRRRLTDGRRPAWVEDDVRTDAHVRRTALPEGTGLLAWCADRILEPLPRERPLWRIDVLALPAQEFALLLVAHHVLADGRRGAAVLRSLLDPPADEHAAVPVPPTRAPARAGAPSNRWSRLREVLADLRTRAPVTSLSRPGGDGRRIAVRTADLAALHAAAGRVGATINDLLLAAVTAGLRALLAARGELAPGLVLRASVPVSSGHAGQPDGMLLVPLPVGEADPRRRLAQITAATGARKSRLRAGGGNVFDLLRLPTPLARAAVRGLRHLAGRAINLFVTDIPGPTEALSLAGAPLLSAVPLAPLTADVPLGVAALSCAGGLHVGIVAGGSVSDLGVLADAMDEEFARLGRIAGEPRRRRVP